ncbi:hypothetical protein [Dongia deserti]|uniref:hypothetical protein n=1 Tax=Dongia deserti TaxID=2268030 RepID=UPI0013C4AE21|nr:hypothetical protein [Dongia deserti]
MFLAAACSATGGMTPARQAGSTTTAAANIDPAAMTPEYIASLPRDQATAAIDSMVDRYLDLAIGRCPNRADACLNEQFKTSFDQTGQLAPLCKVNGLGSEYKLCLMVAAETVPLVKAAGGNLATDVNWANIDGANNEARELFARWLEDTCRGQIACFSEAQTATSLGLSSTVAQSCRVHRRLLDRLDCVSDALSAAVYQRAIKSLS